MSKVVNISDPLYDNKLFVINCLSGLITDTGVVVVVAKNAGATFFLDVKASAKKTFAKT